MIILRNWTQTFTFWSFVLIKTLKKKKKLFSLGLNSIIFIIIIKLKLFVCLNDTIKYHENDPFSISFHN